MFSHAGTVWSEQTKLTANDGANGDLFGISTATNGDNIVNEADEWVKINDSSGRTQSSPCLEVFGPEQAMLTASDCVAYDYFGDHMAIDGDTIIIGSSKNNTDNGSNSDSV